MKFILLNGPPRSGKDTAAAALWDHFGDPVRHEKFSAPLKHGFAGMMGVKCDDFVVDKYEAIKEQRIRDLKFSFRQWQQDFSEKFMKPCYGQNIFGRLLLDRLEQHPPRDNAIIVISDCGFQTEINFLIANVPHENICLIRIHRKGMTFVGDTREYVYHTNVDCFNLYNDDTIEDFQKRVVNLVQWWLDGNNKHVTNTRGDWDGPHHRDL